MNRTNDYNDIIRYLKGRMTDPEAHAFEKKALDDPFLYEAIEGAEGRGVLAYVSDLEQLQLASTKTDRIPIWKIAASVLLLVLSGWVIWQFTSGVTSDLPVAMQENVPNMPTPSKLITDSTASTMPTTSSAEGEQTETEAMASEASRQPSPITKIDDLENPEPSSDEADAVFTMEEASDDEAPQPLETDNTMEPGLPAGLRPAAKSETSTPDQGKKASATRETAYRSQKMPMDQNLSASESADQLKPVIRSVEDLEAYILKNMQLPEAVLADSISGSVILKFMINAAGRPVDIQVKKSLHPTCDTEAIRLLTEGPDWETSENEWTLAVDFPPKKN